MSTQLNVMSFEEVRNDLYTMGNVVVKAHTPPQHPFPSKAEHEVESHLQTGASGLEASHL